MMKKPKNFVEDFVEQVNDSITCSNDVFRTQKYISCIEDQFKKADRFPKYEADDDTVFVCEGCKCLVHVNSLEECEKCEKNYCNFIHSYASICNFDHRCLKKYCVAIQKDFFGCSYVCHDCIKKKEAQHKLPQEKNPNDVRTIPIFLNGYLL